MMRSEIKDFMDQERAKSYLAHHLNKGTLNLFLGSGISQGFGLPDWKKFMKEIREVFGLSDVEATTTEKIQVGIEEALDRIKVDSDKFKIVEKILYKDFIFDKLLAYENKLLFSLYTLLSKQNTPVSKVVSYNYDCILEWYLGLLGMEYQVVVDLPSLERNSVLKIYHPYGFVPHDTIDLKISKELILGMDDANQRIGDTNHPWNLKQKDLIFSGVCLFIGLSSNALVDRCFEPILKNIAKVKKERDNMLTGIWLVFDRLSPTELDRFVRNNIAPIEISDINDLSQFIFEISENSLKNSKNFEI